jgi:hypothetical protein
MWYARKALAKGCQQSRSSWHRQKSETGSYEAEFHVPSVKICYRCAATAMARHESPDQGGDARREPAPAPRLASAASLTRFRCFPGWVFPSTSDFEVSPRRISRSVHVGFQGIPRRISKVCPRRISRCVHVGWRCCTYPTTTG